MAEFVTETFANPIVNRSSQQSVDALESITSVDIASSVPFLKIVKVDLSTGLPDTRIPPLNVFLQKPPEFGAALINRGRYSERPPASIESFKVETRQNYGDIIEQHIEMKVVAHRPSAVFDADDSVWSSLITPGDTHLITYGWSGASKNGMINGQGFDDDAYGGKSFVPGKKSILFTTYYYTFGLKNNGEIEFLIKGMQNGNYVFRQIQLGDVVNANRDVNILNEEKGTLQLPNQFDSVSNTEIRKKLQTLLDSLAATQIKSKKKITKTVKLIDVLNKLVADAIDFRAKQWGYDTVKLLIGEFNPRIPPTSNNFSLSGFDIGNFEMSTDIVMKIITESTVAGKNLTIENFIQNLLAATINNASTWAPGKLLGNKKTLSKLPQVNVKVTDESTERKKVLRVAIFDLHRDAIRFFPETDRLFGSDLGSRNKIKETLAKRKVPMISLGKGFSFVKNAEFEVINDPQIQRAKIDAAAKWIKTRRETTGSSLRDLIQSAPNEYHQIFQSSITGNITMFGNFVFDIFSMVWIDFGVSIWDGSFNIRKRTDTISPGVFETTIELYAEGDDPLNTKRRLTEEQIAETEKTIEENNRKIESKRKIKDR